MHEIDFDMLIQVALESQITSGNADCIKTDLFAESANGPITFTADELLRKKGVFIIPDIYMNAGEVTASYFAWIKNLSHICFGRLERRFDEIKGLQIIETLETMIGKRVPEDHRSALIEGARELDLVRSGLDDTMRTAYQEIHEILHMREEISDFRTAAFVITIEKIANSYIEIGI